MNIPFFSIIIPVYNIENYIGITLHSIEEQTFDDYEVLCINDGSTDNSGTIIDKFSEKNNRFKAIHKSNAGVSSARNLGLEYAKGEWIVFIDGDDAIRQDGLEIIYNAIKYNPQTEIVGYGVLFVNNISEHDLLKKSEDINFYKEDCSSNVSFKALNHYTVWSSAFSNKLLKDLRFENLKNGEDQLFYNKAVLKANYYTEVNVNIYLYLQRSGSAVNSKWTVKKQEDLIIMNRSITENLLKSHKVIDRRWIIRWIKNLLDINDGIWSLNRDKVKYYINEQKKTLRQSLKIKEIPLLLFLWIWCVSHLKGVFLFTIMAGFPVKIYNSIKRLKK